MRVSPVLVAMLQVWQACSSAVKLPVQQGLRCGRQESQNCSGQLKHSNLACSHTDNLVTAQPRFYCLCLLADKLLLRVELGECRHKQAFAKEA